MSGRDANQPTPWECILAFLVLPSLIAGAFISLLYLIAWAVGYA